MKDSRLRITRKSPLQLALDEGVQRYFRERGIDQRGGWRLWLKASIIVGWFIASYALALSGVGGWAGLLIAAVSTGLAMAGLGFNLLHDGGHGAFSTDKRVNRVMGAVADFLGANAYIWRQKHNVLHHTYPNIHGADDDIDVGPLARMAPAQPHYALHRFQHLYMWALYGFISIKWHWWDDFSQLATGRIAGHAFARPKGGELAQLIIGKVVFFTWAIVVPIIVLGWLPALIYYFVAQFCLGVVLAAVFQLAHCVEEAEFPEVNADGTRTTMDFARLQLDSTVDFARENSAITWFLGGLNYQAVHHLYPRISHVHYPHISPIVEGICVEHGVPYRSIGTLRAALRSHYRHLRHLGSAAS